MPVRVVSRSSLSLLTGRSEVLREGFPLLSTMLRGDSVSSTLVGGVRAVGPTSLGGRGGAPGGRNRCVGKAGAQ
eukprot:2400698-Pyramimonas_sp.AAC.1